MATNGGCQRCQLSKAANALSVNHMMDMEGTRNNAPQQLPMSFIPSDMWTNKGNKGVQLSWCPEHAKRVQSSIGKEVVKREHMDHGREFNVKEGDNTGNFKIQENQLLDSHKCDDEIELVD